jgi:hypothetical protein
MRQALARGATLVAAFGLVAVAAAACVPARAVPSPIIVIVTNAPDSPSDTPSATPASSPTPEPTQAASPTIGPTPVVVGSASPSVASDAVASALAAATPTPAAQRATALPASACSGSQANKNFFAQVARELSWDVYCAILPSGWGVRSGGYEGTAPGSVTVSYAGPGGATLALREGAFCTSGAAACAPRTAELGTAGFGDLPGSLAAVSGGFAVYVNPGTTHAYSLAGTGMSQETFVAIAAALVRVAR